MTFLKKIYDDDDMNLSMTDDDDDYEPSRAKNSKAQGKNMVQNYM
jgi:hypothetical protein